jgi:thiol-disulfide isomerase/thioredoxin
MKVGLTFALIAVLMLPPAAAAELLPFGRGSWEELRRAHDGRPAIVHFWGLTCGPCLVELPEWGRFAQVTSAADVIMVAADPVPEEPEQLGATLAKAGLSSVESWRFADRFTERLEYEVDPQWRGELPLTVLLGSDGAVRSILGTVDFADLRTWTEQQSRSSAPRELKR